MLARHALLLSGGEAGWRKGGIADKLGELGADPARYGSLLDLRWEEAHGFRGEEHMKIVLVLVAAFLLIGIVVVTAIGDRDQLVQEREAIDSQWTQVEVVLQRRTELVANLMETVKGHVKPALIKEVDDARAALGGARAPQEKIQANGRLDTPLSRLLLVVDTDPRLKSNENFVHLKDSLDEAENRIAQERRKYNEAIQRYNTDIELFPKNIAAALFGFQRNDAYFKTEPGARVVPHKAF